jgi:hypothetical protein
LVGASSSQSSGLLASGSGILHTATFFSSPHKTLH